MKTLSKKGKILMVLSCTLHALESVIIAAMAYVDGKIIEFVTNGDVSKLGWHCCVI